MEDNYQRIQKLNISLKNFIQRLAELNKAVGLFESETLNYISIFRAENNHIFFVTSFVEGIKTAINNSISEYQEIRKKISSSCTRFDNKYLFEFVRHDKQYEKLITDTQDCLIFIRNKFLTDNSYSHFDSPFAIGKIYCFDSCLRMYKKHKIQLHKLELEDSTIEITAEFEKKEAGKLDHYSIYVNYQDAHNRLLSFGLFLNSRKSYKYVRYKANMKTLYLQPGQKCIGSLELEHNHLVNEPNYTFYFALSIKICNTQIEEIKAEMIDEFLNNLSN